MRLLVLFLLVSTNLFSHGSSSHSYGPINNRGNLLWQGGYLSGQAGGGFIQAHMNFSNSNFFNTLGPVFLGSKFDHRATGGVGGGAFGFNYQMTNYVIGLESGVLYTHLQKKRESPFFPDTDVFTSKLQGLAFAKVRFGYTANSYLFYIDSGWAGGFVEQKQRDTDLFVTSKLKTWTNGWTAGGGLDIMVFNRLSMGVGYNYYELKIDNRGAWCPKCGEGVGLGMPRLDYRSYVQTVVFRFNYYFYL